MLRPWTQSTRSTPSPRIPSSTSGWCTGPSFRRARARTAPLATRAAPRPRRPADQPAASTSSTRTRRRRSTCLRAGTNVVVATGTASGKSLCYQLPIVDAAVRGATDTALLIFPTKALAQDQLRSLRSWLVPGLRAVTYDGDTPPDDRTWARKNATVLLTNPEMIHQGMLPYHQRWSTFLMRLRLVVVDELHATARDLRQSRRQRAAPAATRLRALRLRPHLLLRERDDREPGRAREHDARRAGHAGRRRRIAPGRARLRVVATPAPRRDDGRAGVGQRRDRRAAESIRRRRPPHARIHPQPTRRRARRRRTPAGCCAEPRPGPRSTASPRTAPATSPRNDARSNSGSPAASCSASPRPTRSSSASTSADSTPSSSTASRARSRRCANRSGRAGRAGRRGRRGARRRRRPARPVVRAASRRAVHPAGRGRRRQPAEPVRAAAARRVRRPRAPARRPTTCSGSATDSTTRCGDLVQDDLLKPRGGKMYWAGRHPPAPGSRAAQRHQRRVHARRAPTSRSAGDRHRGRRRASTPSPTPARSTCTRAASGGSRRSTSTAARHTSRPADDADEYTQAREETDDRHRWTPTNTRVAAPGRPTSARSRSPTRWSRTNASRRRPNESIEIVPLDVPAAHPHHPGGLVHAHARGARRRGRRAAAGTRRGPRGRARAHRHAAALRDLRPMGRRRRVDGDPSGHRRADDLHLRRLSRRCRDRPARLRGPRGTRAGHQQNSSTRVRATTGARPACSHRSAGTGTSTSTRSAARRSAHAAHRLTRPLARGQLRPVAYRPTRTCERLVASRRHEAERLDREHVARAVTRERECV